MNASCRRAAIIWMYFEEVDDEKFEPIEDAYSDALKKYGADAVAIYFSSTLFFRRCTQRNAQGDELPYGFLTLVIGSETTIRMIADRAAENFPVSYEMSIEDLRFLWPLAPNITFLWPQECVPPQSEYEELDRQLWAVHTRYVAAPQHAEWGRDWLQDRARTSPLRHKENKPWLISRHARKIPSDYLPHFYDDWIQDTIEAHEPEVFTYSASVIGYLPRIFDPNSTDDRRGYGMMLEAFSLHGMYTIPSIFVYEADSWKLTKIL